MRKAVVALFALILLVQPARAQTTAWADKLFGGVTTHDFGTVPLGTQCKYSFKMTNIYKVPLNITDIRVTCGCLTVTPNPSVRPFPKVVLQPNETAYLHMNMDATRFTGYKSIRVFVTVGPEYISTATLNVSAFARTDVVFNPGAIDFGLVHKGQAATRQIDVEYAGGMGQAWAVSEIVKNASAPFDLKVEELRTSRAAKGYRILATLKPNASAGEFKQEIILKTNDSQSPVLTFHVLGNVQATLDVTPAAVTLAAVKVGEKETKRVVVRGSQPFQILKIDGQGDGLTAVIPKRGAQNTQIVEIRYEPTKPGDLKKDLIIRTNLNDESVTVTVEASATQ